MTPRVTDTLGRLKDRGYLAEDGDLVSATARAATSTRGRFAPLLPRAQGRGTAA